MAYSENYLVSEEEPFQDRDRIIPHKDVKELRQQLVDLTARGIIKECHTVPKAPPGTTINKMVKFCMDFYWLSKQTIPPFFSDQKIEQGLNCLVGNKLFSILGLLTDLGQVPMYPGERTKPYTIKPVGFYEPERMQPGYCSMLVMFQRVMEIVFEDMNLVDVLVFLDYIIIFGKSFEEHQMRLEKTFKRLQQENYKVSMQRSSFCFASIEYFGHLVSEDGIEIEPDKLGAMAYWPEPKTVSELKSLLEFSGFYQHFYKNFAKMAQPLNQLLLEVEADRRRDKEADPTAPWWKRESIVEKWTPECSNAYHSLNGSILSALELDRVSMS